MVAFDQPTRGGVHALLVCVRGRGDFEGETVTVEGDTGSKYNVRTRMAAYDSHTTTQHVTAIAPYHVPPPSAALSGSPLFHRSSGFVSARKAGWILPEPAGDGGASTDSVRNVDAAPLVPLPLGPAPLPFECALGSASIGIHSFISSSSPNGDGPS